MDFNFYGVVLSHLQRCLNRPDMPSTLNTILVVALLLIANAPPSLGQTAAIAEQLVGDPVYEAWASNPGVAQCGLCHYASGNAFATRETDFCGLDEAERWLKNDKHALSRQRIEPLSREEIEERQKKSPAFWIGESNYISYRMCESLGYDIESEAGYARFRDNCLTCHAGYRQGSDDDNFKRASESHPGIACTYCHQLDTKAAWVDMHSSLSAKHTWRVLPPGEKEAAGMRDLFRVSSQAKLCTTCHVGDISQGMFVTHEMYIAGHPPLPNFELEKFLQDMPPHWRDYKTSYDKLSGFKGRDAYFALNLGQGEQLMPAHDVESTFWNTRSMLLGAVHAADRSLGLMVQAGADDPELGTNHWGDYALYDCAACHHELRIPSPRQQRQSSDVPGRPRLLEWPTALLETAMELVAGQQDLNIARSNLQRAINSTPFGDRREAVRAARHYQELLRSAALRLEATAITAAEARRALNHLVENSDDALVNYNSARQIIWAIQLIASELSQGPQALEEGLRMQIAQLGKKDGEVLVSTSLPAKRAGLLYAEGHGNSQNSSFLAEELARLSSYDPQHIRKQISEIRAALQK